MGDTPKEKSLALLRSALENPKAEFRKGQWEIIEQLVNEKAHLLVVQRTGWGKSFVYFVATKLLRDQGCGPTLLITPLLALMRNQIAAAERFGLVARTINSSNHEEWVEVYSDLEQNKIMDGPVLLVDDMVDSRWTFTILAAMLRSAGTGPVYPCALTDTQSKDVL